MSGMPKEAKKVIVTITTDASYHGLHKVGAYAYWITCNLGRLKAAGPLKGKIKNPDEAEIQCILNALHVAKQRIGSKAKKIIVNTDSTNAIAVFENKEKEIKRWGLKWAEHYRKQLLAGSYGLIEFRHVKGHTSNKEAKFWVNNWCDTAAKKQLWIKINTQSEI